MFTSKGETSVTFEAQTDTPSWGSLSWLNPGLLLPPHEKQEQQETWG